MEFQPEPDPTPTGSELRLLPPAAAVGLRIVIWGAAVMQLSSLSGTPGIAASGGVFVPFALASLSAAVLSGWRSGRPGLGAALSVLECAMAAFMVLYTGGLASPWFLLFPWLVQEQWHSKPGLAVVLAWIPASQALSLVIDSPATWSPGLMLAHAGLYGALLTAAAGGARRGERPPGTGIHDVARVDRPPRGLVDALEDAEGLSGRLEPLSRSPSDPARAIRSLAACLGELARDESLAEQDLHCLPFRLDELVESEAGRWAPIACRRGLDIYLHVDPRLAMARFGDRRRLESLLRLTLFAACYGQPPSSVRLEILAPSDEPREISIRLRRVDSTAGEFLMPEVAARLRGRCRGLSGEFHADGDGCIAKVKVDVDPAGDDGASRPLEDLAVHVTGESPLVPTLRDYLSADGAALAADPGSADLILVGECARTHRAEQRCQQLRESRPGVRLLCQGITGGTAAGALLEADGLIPMPLTRQGLARAVREQTLARFRSGRRRSFGQRRAAAASAKAPAQRGHVLVAEDDAISARVATKFLQDAGVRVARTADGPETLAALKRGGLALALIDMRMPGLSGVEVARAFREWEAEQGVQATPLVALTAGDDESDRRSCESAGMDGFLLKPLQRETLLDLVEKYSGSERQTKDALRSARRHARR